MKNLTPLVLLWLFFTSCSGDNNSDSPQIPTNMYFPPTSSNAWETQSSNSLGWNQAAIGPLKDFLTQKNSKSFMILVNGRIVMEEYFNGHNATTSWEWNSAGKTLVAASTGIAQQENLLDINRPVSTYLGNSWTAMPSEKERLIKVADLLSMTSGNDDTKQFVIKSNITYVADAGTRWAYSNVFQKLFDVVAAGSNQNFETYFNAKLKNKIGMDGFWNYGTIFTVYHSTTRSMARFGLLALNKGKWENETIVNETFFNQSITSSQAINPSYGFLWWLNGKSKYMVPSDQTVYQGFLIPSAPADMYAAMGAKDQRIYVIPSKKMVVIRMGVASDPDNPNFAISGFDEELWKKINAVIQ